VERALERFAAGPTVAAEVGSGDAVKAAVVARVGAAVLSRHAVSADVVAGRLVALRVEGLTLTRDLYVVRDRRVVLPPAASLFMAHVGLKTTPARADP
jgi:DNA-binding transcriptional LysR family regulator